MPTKIYPSDTPQQIAQKIYNHFERGDCIQIYGWVTKDETLVEKGEEVWNWIKWYYDQEYYGHNGRARTFRYKQGSIGGPLAHPIFTRDKVFVEGEPRITIWRYQ